MAGAMLAVASSPAPLRAAQDDAPPVHVAHDDVIEVIGPTLIAFFPRLSPRRIESNPELVYMLDDFYEHLKSIGTKLVAAGVRIYARPAGEIRILEEGRVRTLVPPPEGGDIGYYMVAPGLEATLVSGVQTDGDLIDEMDRNLAPGVSTYDAAPPIAFKIEDGALQIFGYVLQPEFEIRMAESPEEEDASSFSFPSSSDGRWIVIVHSRDEDLSEFWLYDRQTGTKPARIPIGSARHGEVTWHGDDVFEVTFAGAGHTVSELVRVTRPDEPYEVTDLLHYDVAQGVYVSFISDGVEIGRPFQQGHASKERFPIDLDPAPAGDARMTIEKVDIEGEVVTVSHRRQDGTLAYESIRPRLLQR